MGRRIVLALALAASASSATSCAHAAVLRALQPPPALECPDRAPVRLLIDRACADGICGWSCAPGRWEGSE